ncbi:MAG: HAD family phosphatase [Candidatus Omnitrophica bacterium]|nr:HAD family phosphatase [Candidatus Omnitrophota bacterium]
MKILNLKAVIFDMDGVITNTMPDHYRAWVKILKENAGIHPTKLDIYLKEGSPGIDCLYDIFKKYHKPYNETIARKCLNDKEAYFKTLAKTKFIPGARSFLKKLHKQNFKLALVTGTSRPELHRILPDNIFNLFSVVITGNDVKKGKPHPEPYLKAIKKLRLKKSDSVVIENAPFGITAAKRAKLLCLALETSLPKKYINNADMIFPSIKQMLLKIKFENFNHDA